ncbi:hypothetical protein BC826DRAFT_1041974 [Russula brevipes]|nr:hypothetical protein BC826DRAFT_1041974 [Russula brevipes]
MSELFYVLYRRKVRCRRRFHYIYQANKYSSNARHQRLSRPSSRSCTRPPILLVLIAPSHRLRPPPSRLTTCLHAPCSLSLFAALRLESGHLSPLNGFFFSFGGVHARFLGLRSAGYLYDDGGRDPSIRTKLGKVLQDFGVERAEEEMDDTWMLTMPSYCGFEGTNPLTDCSTLWIVVLEILSHATSFPHVFCGFDHQWTSPHAFHVSPFNDLLGTYTISIGTPFPHGDAAIALPLIRVQLHTPASSLKLSVSLRTKHATLFTSRAVLAALATHPFTLFLTLPRILSEAALLHYRRRLDVHKRPEPEPVRWLAATAAPARIKGGGIGWQRPTLLERAAQRTVSAFFARRANALGVCITLEPGDSSARVQRFGGARPPLSPGGTSDPARPGTLTALRRGRGSGGAAHDDVREFVASEEALRSGRAWAAARLLRLLPGRRDEDEDEQARQSGAGGEGRRPGHGPHPLVPGGRVDQVGFVLLLCVLVVVEWAEELLWRVARVRWAVR